MKINNLISNLLFPPKCANCDEFLDVSLAEKQRESLCPSCRLYYESEKLRECSICGLSMEFCRCMPKNMSKAQCSSLLKLITYRANDENLPIRKFVYSVKHKDYRANFDFIAEQMKKLLILEMRAASLMPSDCIITFLPRSHKNKAKDGFDQSFRLAKALADITGIEFVSCFRRKFRTTEQKKLNTYERRLNMRSAYKPRRVEDKIKGKTVILVDDIVTTGASMASCARIAFSMGAYAVIGVCLGYTEKNHKNKM